jgi:hypothetical protein
MEGSASRSSKRALALSQDKVDVASRAEVLAADGSGSEHRHATDGLQDIHPPDASMEPQPNNKKWRSKRASIDKEVVTTVETVQHVQEEPHKCTLVH